MLNWYLSAPVFNRTEKMHRKFKPGWTNWDFLTAIRQKCHTWHFFRITCSAAWVGACCHLLSRPDKTDSVSKNLLEADSRVCHSWFQVPCSGTQPVVCFPPSWRLSALFPLRRATGRHPKHTRADDHLGALMDFDCTQKVKQCKSVVANASFWCVCQINYLFGTWRPV